MHTEAALTKYAAHCFNLGEDTLGKCTKSNVSHDMIEDTPTLRAKAALTKAGQVHKDVTFY